MIQRILFKVFKSSCQVGILLLALQPIAMAASLQLPVSPAGSLDCTQIIQLSLQDSSAEGASQFTEEASEFQNPSELQFRKDFDFVGIASRVDERMNYYKRLLAIWADSMSRSKISPLASQYLGSIGPRPGGVLSVWNAQRDELLQFFSVLGRRQEITSKQVMAAAWWMASVSTVSKLPDSRWYKRDVVTTFLPTTLSSLLVAKENAFALYSGAARKMKWKGGESFLVNGTLPFEMLPVSAPLNFINMNFLFLRRAFVMGVPLVNRLRFDGFESFSIEFLGHDDLHAIRALAYQERMESLLLDYHRGVAIERQPLRRRLAEYVFYRVWHEDIELFNSVYGEGQLMASKYLLYQKSLRKFADQVCSDYLRFEMKSHAELFGPTDPTCSQMDQAVNLVLSALGLPSLIP